MGSSSVQKEESGSSLFLDQILVYGEDAGCGNLVLIQPYMLAADYCSRDSYLAKLDGYLAAAHAQGWFSEKTIVVLPEYLGAWLVAVGEKPDIYATLTMHAAAKKMAGRHFLAYLRSYLRTQAKARSIAAVFMMKAQKMAAVYDSVARELSGKYGVTLVPGSIILPGPRMEHGRLAVTAGMLFNVAAVYRPDGTPYEALTMKTRPVQEEQDFLGSAAEEALPVYQTPAGALAVLICADAFYPEAYAAVTAKGAEIIVVPSHGMIATEDFLARSWQGYNGGLPPADVDLLDIGRLTEHEAWLKYALPGRIGAAGAANGGIVFLQGEMWDLLCGGRSLVMRGGRVFEPESASRAVLINSWLP